jgi:hypothetical protein
MGPSDAVKQAEQMKNKIMLPYDPIMKDIPGGTNVTVKPSAKPPMKQNIKAPPGMNMKAKKQPAGMAKGGLAEGGMLQEGGSVDPVSGNEVPPGALQEEVRDDIPAQLSEGEFVFPADVVRFIGLEKLMQLRQLAKQGLARMEQMGQMSNADEATMEDDGAFESEIDDIIEEVENENNGS